MVALLVIIEVRGLALDTLPRLGAFPLLFLFLFVLGFSVFGLSVSVGFVFLSFLSFSLPLLQILLVSQRFGFQTSFENVFE